MAMTEAKKRNEGTMTLRVDRDLLKAFQNIAKDNNRTASQLVRDYMMNYVKKHGQGDLFKWAMASKDNTYYEVFKNCSCDVWVSLYWCK